MLGFAALAFPFFSASRNRVFHGIVVADTLADDPTVGATRFADLHRALLERCDPAAFKGHNQPAHGGPTFRAIPDIEESPPIGFVHPTGGNPNPTAAEGEVDQELAAGEFRRAIIFGERAPADA